jgi:hypothetical protein
MLKGLKIFLEKLKNVKNYLHFLLKNGRILGIRNNKLADKGSQMTTTFFLTMRTCHIPSIPSIKLRTGTLKSGVCQFFRHFYNTQCNGTGLFD